MKPGLLDDIIRAAAIEDPNDVPTPRDWTMVEGELGVALPSEYKELVSALGSGYFGCGLYLRNPVARLEGIRLTRSALLKLNGLLTGSAKKSALQLYPDPGGLIVAAGMDRQLLLIQAANVVSAVGLIWWDLDLHKFVSVNMGLARFIYDVYRGQLHETWALQFREYVWRQSEPFFTRLGEPGGSGGLC
jgi:hypothetical protein